jgi:lipopolysaccharide/colanic/teichoic acid biosynthesis glycosyltransferase
MEEICLAREDERMRKTEQKAMDIQRLVGLLPPASFHDLLRKERSRSNRDGSDFSLVLYNVRTEALDHRAVDLVARSIRERMRSIDQIGWFNEQSIGVLLPVTNLQGARRFANRVCESTKVRGPSLQWIVHSYPAHWPAEGEGSSCNDSSQPVLRHESSHRKESKRNGSGVDGVENIFGRKHPLWKRCIDIVGSIVLIVVLSPLFLLLSLYIKCISPGKVLFKQNRVGYQKKLFTFLKFRTMHQNNDPYLHRSHLKELIKGNMPMEKLDLERDPRIIPGGRILRETCLDELPQLFNVLRGDMSLVGPRPCIPYEADEYLRWHTNRFDALPGMTGLWQVSGKNRLSFEQMIRLDIAYSARMSLLLDLKILFLTLPTVLSLAIEAGVKRLLRKSPRARSLSKGGEEGTFGTT